VPGTHAVHAAGLAHHLLRQRVALARVRRLLRGAEQVRRRQAQGLAGPRGQAAADDQVDAAAGAHLVQEYVGLQLELADHVPAFVEDLALIGA
jgi:hypothetical protein